VALRLREQDFAPGAEIVGDSGAQWPFDYAALSPYYDWAEALLGVAGDDAGDPTAPPRLTAYPQAPAPFTRPSRRIAEAARQLGLHPFPLPLAINFGTTDTRAACRLCCTCDGFACAIGAKNDLATGLIPMLQGAGMELRANTVAVQLTGVHRRVTGVTCVDRRTGQVSIVHARQVILAAGTLATPHLLLASGLERLSPAPQSIGRYLMRHNNLLALGVFGRATNPHAEFHKQVAIHDFYFGAPGVDPSIGKLGCIQQITAPGREFVRKILPAPIGHLAAIGVPNVLALLCIAEDQPLASNGVTIDATTRDSLGLPTLAIRHRYTPRDRAAGRALVGQARRVLRQAGALCSVLYDLRSFSHAVGTVRMGVDERTAPLDERGRFRGLDNLYITDGSVLPTSGGVNPSLTIAATALRVGALLAGTPVPTRPRARRTLPTAPPASHVR
jgi:choline dehydrogenase-like flavoprotein